MFHHRYLIVIFMIILLLAITNGEFAKASDGNKTAIGIESLQNYVANTDLIFVGEVYSVEYECFDNKKSSAYVSLKNIECWLGAFPEEYPVVVSRIEMPNCKTWVDKTRPNPIEVGAKYLFLCNRSWSWDLNNFQNELFVSVEGLLCISPNQELDFCGGGKWFTFENPGEKLREALRKISLEQMFYDADLVVVASDFSIPENPSSFNFAQIQAGTECRVEQVLKGEFSLNNLAVNPHPGGDGLGSVYKALISSSDRSVLFLKSGPNGYGLMYGPKSYFPLEKGWLFSNSRLPMGVELVGDKLVKGEK